MTNLGICRTMSKCESVRVCASAATISTVFEDSPPFMDSIDTYEAERLGRSESAHRPARAAPALDRKLSSRAFSHRWTACGFPMDRVDVLPSPSHITWLSKRRNSRNWPWAILTRPIRIRRIIISNFQVESTGTHWFQVLNSSSRHPMCQ